MSIECLWMNESSARFISFKATSGASGLFYHKPYSLPFLLLVPNYTKIYAKSIRKCYSNDLFGNPFA